MKIDRDAIMDDIEEIQEQIDGMGFCGSNEKELWTREAIADYIVKKIKLSNVSQQRELLIDAIRNMTRGDFELRSTSEYVDEYLESINCG